MPLSCLIAWPQNIREGAVAKQSLLPGARPQERESSFPAEEALGLLSAGQKDPAASFKCAVYRQMVTHALDVEGYSFDQLVARAGDRRLVFIKF